MSRFTTCKNYMSWPQLGHILGSKNTGTTSCKDCCCKSLKKQKLIKSWVTKQCSCQPCKTYILF